MYDSSHIVTAVRPSKAVAGRYSVYVDRKFAASLTAGELAKLGLKAGARISASEFQHMFGCLETVRLREAAFRLLSYRSRSERELADGLAMRGFSEQKIQDLISEFREKNLLSDRRFAEEWVDGRLRTRPRGRRLLLMELLAKGVSEDIAREVVAERFAGVDEAELAFELVAASRSRFERENSVDRKRKICNFLRYRGFDADVILHATDRFLEELDVDAC